MTSARPFGALNRVYLESYDNMYDKILIMSDKKFMLTILMFVDISIIM